MPMNIYGRGSEVFWGEISPCEHLVQFYEEDGVFLDTLEGFVGGGLRAGESVIVIATPTHLQQLDERLNRSGIDMASACDRQQYLTFDADETLKSFMKDGWPNEELFFQVIRALLAPARKNSRKVRAFGEMVALMWARGEQGATVRLEHLWHELCATENFSLLCAYPKAGFTESSLTSLDEICAAHSRVLPH